MQKKLVTGIVSASLLLSGTSVFAQSVQTNGIDSINTNTDSITLTKKTGLENAFDHVKNENTIETILRNTEKQQGEVTKEDDENHQDGNHQDGNHQDGNHQDINDQDGNHVTTGDEIVVAPTPPTTGDTITVNQTVEITNEITVKLNGKVLTFDQNPVVENGRTLVPLREIFQSLGVKIDWDGKTGTVKAEKGNRNVMVKIGSTTARVNGKIVKLDQKAEIINKRTMIPLRFISESFGANVKWDQFNRVIDITEK
ncbi:copper amine oxidase N-terminal domain-containing protein [Aneurinibacillus terranovensis]|uniref:copper amine oxidase N-terminal domain-containing protein n=1 Tax=Aneurinibacillus terranovensis TaxID=278991 RepID=UPI000419CD4C|nr:copper amine oxidase N-terminal domain-containing protein [Aneurinibacillus terranovensis]